MLNDQRLPFDLIRPLIDETALKVMDDFPANTQTGPAARNDQKVMARQRAFLKKYPAAQKIYNEISADILKKSSRRKK